MNKGIIHEDPSDVEALPASVHQLDALWNERVANTKTDAELDHAMHEKLRVKRALAKLSPARLEAAALAALQELSGAA